jgi:hypothetical protein
VIATDAPHLPSVRLPEQRAQRFPFHYLLGLVAHAFGLGVPTTYRIAVILLSLLLAAVLIAVLATVQASDWVAVICLAGFVLNTYSLRYYMIAPGTCVDLFFEAGMLVVVLGLLRRSFPTVMGGVVAATLARQTAVPVSLGVAAWLAFGPGWSDASAGVRAVRAGAAVLSSVVLFIIAVRVAAPFSAGTTPDFAHWTMLADLEHLPSGLGNVGQHFLRSVNGLFSVLALIVVAAVAIKRRSSDTRLPREFWWCMLLAGLVIVQPVILSPEYVAHNETRLTVLGVPTLVVGLAFLLRDLESRARPLSRATALALVAILAVGSLHHLFTVIGTASARQTVILQAVAAACLAAVLWHSTQTADQTPMPR